MLDNANHFEIILKLVRLSGSTEIAVEDLTFSHLHGDGSDRIFYRVSTCSGAYSLAVFPSQTLDKSMQEAMSCFLIGQHLALRSVAVPQILAFDHASGAILYEYLGDKSLFDLVKNGNEFEIDDLYSQVLEQLTVFQVDGVNGFKKDYCWDTSFYDCDLMISRESHYFKDQFCRKLLQFTSFPDDIELDFTRLATRISKEKSNYLLHRDYQSRNIMVTSGSIRIIDFQGARFGPLAYDLASLLNDPYVALSENNKEKFLKYYLKMLSNKISLDSHCFIKGYYHIALQRNLQVLGAYAFLSCERGKQFFRQFIEPALNSLQDLLDGPLSGKYPALYSVANQARQIYLTKFS